MEPSREHNFGEYIPPVEPTLIEQPETLASREMERGAAIERSGEQHMPITQATTPPAQAMQLPTPVVSQADDTAQHVSITDDNPVIAADADLIEKEWVDRAKKIVEQTKNDPHEREQQVSKLQVDYVKKRYGRDIGSE